MPLWHSKLFLFELRMGVNLEKSITKWCLNTIGFVCLFYINMASIAISRSIEGALHNIKLWHKGQIEEFPTKPITVLLWGALIIPLEVLGQGIEFISDWLVNLSSNKWLALLPRIIAIGLTACQFWLDRIIALNYLGMDLALSERKETAPLSRFLFFQFSHEESDDDMGFGLFA